MVSTKLEQLRRQKGISQSEVAAYMTRHGMGITQASVSKWEKGQTSPNAEQFLLLCRLYGVRDVLAVFFSDDTVQLNELGYKRLREYEELLSLDARFTKQRECVTLRKIPLYDIPASAGTGIFLDSSVAEDIEVDDSVPMSTDYALRISGDSMIPRFDDGQIVYVHSQTTLEDGEIGIFYLNGNVYCKVLDVDKQVHLRSLNPKYAPIRLTESDDFRVLGKVVL